MSTSKNIGSSANIAGCVPSDFKAASGKQNFMSSLNSWLVDVVRGGQVGGTALGYGKDFFWAFNFPIAPLMMPAVGVSEIGLFDLGKRAFDGNLVGLTVDGKPIRAVRNQTLVEINCWAQDSDDFGGATKKVYELRDRVVLALEFAGVMNDNEDGFIIPPIRLRDFSRDGAPVMGVIWLDPSGNSINEKFLVDPVVQNLRRYKLMVRFLYDEYKDPL